MTADSKNTSKLIAWIKAMRLRTLPLAFSNILLGTALAHKLYAFDPIILSLTLLTTLCLQVLSNFANDFGDFSKGTDNQERIGPQRTMQGGLITKKQMISAMIICGLIAFVSGAALLLYAFQNNIGTGIIFFFALGFSAIAAAVFYTIGKRAYGYRGLGDLFVFIFFGLVGVIGSACLQTQTFDSSFLLAGITMGCFSVAVLNLNNMRDIKNDQASNKITLAVKLGLKSAKVYHFFLFFVAYASFVVLVLREVKIELILLLFSIPVVIIHLMHLLKVSRTSDPKDFDPHLKIIAISALLFSVLIYSGLFLT